MDKALAPLKARHRELAANLYARNEMLETFADLEWFLRSLIEGRWGRARKFHRAMLESTQVDLERAFGGAYAVLNRSELVALQASMAELALFYREAER